MPLTQVAEKLPDVSVEQRTCDELTKLVRKLRWMGFEKELSGRGACEVVLSAVVLLRRMKRIDEASVCYLRATSCPIRCVCASIEIATLRRTQWWERSEISVLSSDATSTKALCVQTHGACKTGAARRLQALKC
jgi:hypothetical protein